MALTIVLVAALLPATSAVADALPAFRPDAPAIGVNADGRLEIFAADTSGPK